MPIRKVILQPCVMPAGHMLCYSITSMVRQRGRETQIQVYEPHHCYITESWEIIKMERMYMCKGWMLKSCWDSHKRHHGYIKLQYSVAHYDITLLTLYVLNLSKFFIDNADKTLIVKCGLLCANPPLLIVIKSVLCGLNMDMSLQFYKLCYVLTHPCPNATVT